jgi:hypothetical protein
MWFTLRTSGAIAATHNPAQDRRLRTYLDPFQSRDTAGQSPTIAA